jgi:hypothetical protein
MTQKTFFIKLKHQKNFHNTLLAEIYCKNMVRYEENNVLTLDNNQLLFNFISRKKILSGSSVLGKNFFFKHKFDQKLKFKAFLPVSTHRTKNLLQNILLKIKTIVIKKNFISSLVVLGPKKGGFYGISLSTPGFIPKSQSRALFKTVLKYKEFQKSSLMSIIILLTKNNFIKNFYLFKINYGSVKMKFYPTYKNYCFSKQLTRKSRKNNNILNFVFYEKKI